MSYCVEGSEGVESHVPPTAVERRVESLAVGVTSLSKQKPACKSMAGFPLPGTMMYFPRTTAPLDLIDLKLRANLSDAEQHSYQVLV